MQNSDTYLRKFTKKFCEKQIDRFKNYHAYYTNYGRLKMVDFIDPTQPEHDTLKFIFNCDDSTLYVDGSFSQGIFKFYSSKNTFWDIAKLAKDTGYFMEKEQIKIFDHQYDKQLAILQFNKVMHDCLDQDKELLAKAEAAFKDFIKENLDPVFAENEHASEDALRRFKTDVLQVNADEYLEDEPEYGKRISVYPLIWLTVLTIISNGPVTYMPCHL